MFFWLSFIMHENIVFYDENDKRASAKLIESSFTVLIAQKGHWKSVEVFFHRLLKYFVDELKRLNLSVAVDRWNIINWKTELSMFIMKDILIG